MTFFVPVFFLSGRRCLFRLERRHVNGEAVFHIALGHAVVIDLLDRDDVAVMLCCRRKSISCVSAMPPMGEPDRLRRPMINEKAEMAWGFPARRRG
jgi:hypothetical protein